MNCRPEFHQLKDDLSLFGPEVTQEFIYWPGLGGLSMM